MKIVNQGIWPLMLLLSWAYSGAAFAQSPADPAQPVAAPPAANLNSMPKWSEFPVPPKDVPTAADIRQKVLVAENKRRQLNTEVDAIVWDEGDPDAYAKAAFAKIDPEKSEALSLYTTPEAMDARAAELRRRAAPPPIAK
ncbi:MAG: hypothetical protein WBQ60_04820 [Asticcacaulis sp.]